MNSSLTFLSPKASNAIFSKTGATNVKKGSSNSLLILFLVVWMMEWAGQAVVFHFFWSKVKKCRNSKAANCKRWTRHKNHLPDFPA